MLCFLGSTHAANHLHRAARQRGLILTNDPGRASVVFVSEDAAIGENGARDLTRVNRLLETAKATTAQIVLTSQVPPGFTRSLKIPNILHQAETLRIIDAEERALNPEYIAVGGDGELHPHYAEYLLAFKCPVLRMSWEEAEMSKIAVNMFLAAQVDTTNRLAAASARVGAKWENVAKALALDSRIGPECYLKPGRWQDSQHLLRDAVTLKEIES